MKGKSAKGIRAYNAWEEKDERSSSDSCSSLDDKCINICLMERKKSEDSRVYLILKMNLHIDNCLKLLMIGM